jgi:hypothetical protein
MKYLTNYRYLILAIILSAATICLFVIPKESTEIIAYIAIFIGSKLVSLILYATAWVLCKNTWKGQLHELKKLIEED